MPLLGEIPGYAEAVERESFDRLAAFIDCTETIAGVRVVQLTPRLTLELEAAGSPFFTANRIPAEPDVAAFLWHVSTHRLRPCPWWVSARRWDERLRDEFALQIVHLHYLNTAMAIQDYIAEANADGPSEGGPSGIAIASAASSIVDYIAHRYGWSEAEILDIPWKRLWQYWRRITLRESSGEQTFINRSDLARATYLDKLNAANKEKAAA